jgi:translation initiation factor 3 subunit A
LQKLENYDTEGLITIQVAQLEKEKRELNEKLRIIAKRIDHIERAYRKEERPLLAQDYAEQQKSDREKYLVTQAAHKEASYQAHLENIETKKRLARMMGDYKVRKEVLMEKRGVEYEKRVQNAKRKMDEEKEKRKRMVMKQREEEEAKREREEAERRRKEEDAERIERGMSVFSFYLIRS